MAVLPKRSFSSLELTIAVPGLSSSSYLPSPGEGGGLVRDLDINRKPCGGEEWTAGSMEEELDESNNFSGRYPRKKLRLTKEQSRLLEQSFTQNQTLNPKQKESLAMELKLKPRQVEVWFQNRRARSKLKQTEMECEYLKRWLGSLTEQNRRLKKEVEELRGMRVGPAVVLTPHTCEPLPASTLSMCPGCERVTATAHDKGPTGTATTNHHPRHLVV